MTIQITQKIVIKPNTPLQFKKEVGRLLNELMKDYKIKGKNKEFENAFKTIFKSNLYYTIDNHYEIKPTKK